MVVNQLLKITFIDNRVISAGTTRYAGLAEIFLEPYHEELGLGGRIQKFFVHNVMIY